VHGVERGNEVGRVVDFRRERDDADATVVDEVDEDARVGAALENLAVSLAGTADASPLSTASKTAGVTSLPL